jgi:phosphatidylserine decarboxylase
VVSYVFFGITTIIYLVVVNFFRCPIRHYEEPDTEGLIIAPADGKIVVIEEVEENEYFHDRRLMVSIFMSLFNVHANWVPCDGKVKLVRHHDGRFKAAWLPKASTENERSTVVIESSTGQEILVRQVAGAMARRIVTYLQEGEECEIDEHMGFIKFGSRVDIYLPIGTKVNVELGQRTTGNETIIARLS